MKIYPFLGCFVLCLIISACDNANQINTPSASIKFPAQSKTQLDAAEAVRRRIGLRSVQGLVLVRSEADFDDWKVRTSDKLLAKRASRDLPGNAVDETDYYYSGIEFADMEGTQREQICVNYDYKKNEMTVTYIGTNAATETLFAPFKISASNGPTTNFDGVMAVVRAATKNWPNGARADGNQ
jgi:hypothetical protein